MPFGDRTGPIGAGPMTGRGAGYCAGFITADPVNPVVGRGRFGSGRSWGIGHGSFGRGYGWRCWYRATGLTGWAKAGYGYTPFVPHPYVAELTGKQEMDILKDQADFLKKQLEDIERRVSILKKTQSQEGE